MTRGTAGGAGHATAPLDASLRPYSVKSASYALRRTATPAGGDTALELDLTRE